MHFSETCEYLRGLGYITQRGMPQRQMRKLYEKMKYLAKAG